MKGFSLSVVFACLLLVKANAQVNSQDSLALSNIYNTTNGNAWTQKWIRTQPVNTWFGVTISAGRVTGLNLQGNNLAGSLNSANIAKLTKLKVLNLDHNSLSGSIPAGIGSLTELEQLNLSFNAFTGTTPSGLFNNLQQLTHVNFANNNISGWFPSSVSNATALAEINFANNAMTNKIPTTINNLTLLTKFLVNNNKLIGPFPTGRLCSATVQVDVSSNQFNFTGLECLGANPNATYNNQEDLSLTQSSLKLSVAAGGTLTNNTYTWYRNDDYFPYHTTSNGSITSLNVVETGSYRVVVTNNQLPGLELKSNTVTISNVSTLLPQDSLALVDIYNSTKGAQWFNKTNWLTSAPLQDWYGIEIINGRVGNIFLNENNLEGTLPGSLKNLTGLKNIEMVKNKLSGLLPDLTKSPQLFTIRLAGNKYRGTLPANWGTLVHLAGLEVSNNQLTGPIPESYGNLRDLGTVILSHNQLTGQIPERFSTIGFFEGAFDHNLFTGPLPQGFCTTEYSSANIQHNKFNFSGLECLGNPESPGNATYANQAAIPLINENPVLKVAAGGTPGNNTYKWYKDNVLVSTKTGDSTYTMLASGSYHAIITNSQATELTLSSDTAFFNVSSGLMQDSLALVDFYNGVTSGLNWVLTNPVSTWEGVTIENGRVVDLFAAFDLTGTLSSSLGNLSAIRSIWIGHELSGSIPTSICNLTQLEYLAISGNFTGVIPDDLGKHQQSLFHLEIGGNLTGQIPSGLQYATKLSELYLSGNQLSGSIPSFFKKLPIFNLSLSNNKLTGSIPDTLSTEEGLSSVELNNNQLTGSIPKWLGNHRTIFLELSHNKLSGPLPDSINTYGSWVRLSNNKFTGSLPEFAGSFGELDVSSNLLDRIDPNNCNSTTYLSGLNISNNKLNFTSLECLKTNPNLGDAIISPQQRIPIINENPVLKASAGGNLANNTYRWLRNTGHFVTKVGDSTLTITTPGVYACIVTNSAVPGVELRTHNANISTVSSRKMQPASPDDLAGAIPGKLSVYPNPTGNDFIYIKGLQKAESILLYNASGQLVKQWQNVNGGQQLNIGSITNGVYMVKVVEKDKQTMLKFIKQ